MKYTLEFIFLFTILSLTFVSAIYSGETQEISTDYTNITGCIVLNNISYINCNITSLSSVNVSVPTDALAQNFNIVIYGWKERTQTSTTYSSGSSSGGGIYIPINKIKNNTLNNITNSSYTPINNSQEKIEVIPINNKEEKLTLFEELLVSILVALTIFGVALIIVYGTKKLKNYFSHESQKQTLNVSQDGGKK